MAIDLRTIKQAGPFALSSCLGENGVLGTFAGQSDRGEAVCVVVMAREQLAKPEVWQTAEQASQRLQSGMPNGCLTPVMWGQESGFFYMAYPFLQGVHLGGRVNASGLPSTVEVLEIGIGVLHALRELHNLGVSHRALNPASIFLPADGSAPLLLHCGWSRLLINAQGGPLNDNLMCILPFLAPEVVAQEGADTPSDIYSLAANLFFLLTGEPLFWDDAPDGLARLILTSPANLSALDALGNRALKELMEDMLEKDPEDRPPNIEALINRFQQVRDAMGGARPVVGRSETASQVSFSEQATMRFEPGMMEGEITSRGMEPVADGDDQRTTKSEEFQKPPSARELHQAQKKKSQQENLYRAQEAAEMARLERERQAEMERQASIDKQKQEIMKKRQMLKKALMVAAALLFVLMLAGGVYALYSYISSEEQQGQQNVAEIRKTQEEEAKRIKAQQEAKAKVTKTHEALKTYGTHVQGYLKRFGTWPVTFEDLKELKIELAETRPDGWGTELQLRGEGFIVSAGPDAKFDTKDDLWINSQTQELGP